MIYPNKVKEMRLSKNMSQVELAAYSKLSPSTVNRIEAGYAELTDYTANKIANTLGVLREDLQCPNHMSEDAKTN